MAGQKNLRHRIEQRQKDAVERQTAREELGDEKQLDQLVRYWNGEGKEATRLRSKIAKDMKKK